MTAHEIHDFVRGVTTEAEYQREHWGSEHDAGKTPADWFWLIGYLAGKALAAHIGGNTEKALHHTISTAAALCNWHAAILGKTNMRPGSPRRRGNRRSKHHETRHHHGSRRRGRAASARRAVRRVPIRRMGILFSAKRHGTPRYPSVGWIRQLVEDYGETRISAHLCGAYARGDVIGKPPRYVNHFDRVQINGYEPGCIPGGSPTAHPTRILQCRSETDLHRVLFDAAWIGGHVLFDPSGGRGASPDRWPIDQPDRVPLGYAGGITPDNVRDVLRDIGPCGPDAWIDMESGVRTDDAFDLAKVRAVLEAVAGSGWAS